jgi:hypothetical protein
MKLDNYKNIKKTEWQELANKFGIKYEDNSVVRYLVEKIAEKIGVDDKIVSDNELKKQVVDKINSDFEVVPVEVAGNPYEMKKRILGPNAINIKNLMDSVASNGAVRMRLRGIGSSYIEGPNQTELQEPLHFNVCAENEQFLHTAVNRLKEFLFQVSTTFGNRK